jgi:hypothetical protein
MGKNSLYRYGKSSHVKGVPDLSFPASVFFDRKPSPPQSVRPTPMQDRLDTREYREQLRRQTSIVVLDRTPPSLESPVHTLVRRLKVMPPPPPPLQQTPQKRPPNFRIQSRERAPLFKAPSTKVTPKHAPSIRQPLQPIQTLSPAKSYYYAASETPTNYTWIQPNLPTNWRDDVQQEMENRFGKFQWQPNRLH